MADCWEQHVVEGMSAHGRAVVRLVCYQQARDLGCSQVALVVSLAEPEKKTTVVEVVDLVRTQVLEAEGKDIAGVLYRQTAVPRHSQVAQLLCVVFVDMT
jgi:hypothetical protein